MLFVKTSVRIQMKSASNNLQRNRDGKYSNMFYSVSLWNWFWRIISQMKFTDSIIDWIFINIPFVLRSGWLYGQVPDHCWPVRYLPNVQPGWQIYKPHKQKLGKIKLFISVRYKVRYFYHSRFTAIKHI